MVVHGCFFDAYPVIVVSSQNINIAFEGYQQVQMTSSYAVVVKSTDKTDDSAKIAHRD